MQTTGLLPPCTEDGPAGAAFSRLLDVISRSKHVGIVGGGMLGLTLALRLSAQGHRVTVLEAAENAGGLAAPWQLDGYRWDRFYHVILMSDTALRDLLEELGLSDRVVWRETKTGFYTDGRLHSVSNALEFLQFPPLGLIDKLRLGATIAYVSRVRNWRRLEHIPVADWLERLSGRRTCEKIWLPLLRAKLGENYQHVSAAFIWATISRMYAARRTGLKKEMFGYVCGGYATILGRMVAVLEDRGVELVTGAPVAGIAQAGGSAIEATTADGNSRRFDACVLTLPTPLAARICPGLSSDERSRLEQLPYQGIVCASLLLSKPLGPFYITNITDDGLPFTGVIEMGALVDRSEFGGNSLVYLPRYLTQSDPAWQEDDRALRERFLNGLSTMYPSFRADDVRAFRIARARYVQALPTLEYSRRWAPAMETSLPGLYIVTGAQIVNGTLNVNETVMLANRKAQELSERFVH